MGYGSVEGNLRLELGQDLTQSIEKHYFVRPPLWAQKVPQSPKPRKFESNEKVAKKWLWGSTRKYDKVTKK